MITSVVDGCTLLLQINIDGLPLFKSSRIRLWPILGLLLSANMKEPVVIEMYCGHTKPSSTEEFLKDFIAQLQKLEQGFTLNKKIFF